VQIDKKKSRENREAPHRSKIVVVVGTGIGLHIRISKTKCTVAAIKKAPNVDLRKNVSCKQEQIYGHFLR
jgi:hypothetical protein